MTTLYEYDSEKNDKESTRKYQTQKLQEGTFLEAHAERKNTISCIFI